MNLENLIDALAISFGIIVVLAAGLWSLMAPATPREEA